MKKRTELQQDFLSERALRDAYAEQLAHVGAMLVRAGILEQSEVERQGVRFALRDKLEPITTVAHREAASRA